MFRTCRRKIPFSRASARPQPDGSEEPLSAYIGSVACPAFGPAAARAQGGLVVHCFSPSLPGHGHSDVWVRCYAQPDLGKSELLSLPDIR